MSGGGKGGGRQGRGRGGGGVKMDDGLIRRCYWSVLIRVQNASDNVGVGAI